MSAMLAARQQAFLAALGAARDADAIALAESTGAFEAKADWQAGLRAYRSNAHMLSLRVLEGAYPVTAQLLGPANFAPLARRLWQGAPPEHGDLALWGEGLAALIESIPQLASAEPYLADVARIEWRLHAAAAAADGRQDLASIALLADGDPQHIALDIAPGTACVVSAFAAASIVLAHVDGAPTLEEAGERLRAGAAETAVVWRDGHRPRVRLALAGEADWLAALQETRSLADSMRAAPALDFAAWLQVAAETGLLLGARAFP
jgi:hypothetical protein